jgi:hydroxymethylbilane synthase
MSLFLVHTRRWLKCRHARVGTSFCALGADRRAASAARDRLLRGNVDTRLAKLDRGEYDAIVLAAAGLQRLGLVARATAHLEVDEMLPAPGQGALGIECLAARGDVAALLAPLADRATTACVRAERAVSRALGGSCSLPLAAYAVRIARKARLRRSWLQRRDKRVIRCDLEEEAGDPEAVASRPRPRSAPGC